MRAADWRVVHCPGTGLAESPRWAHGQLRWVDIPGRAMFAFDGLPQGPNAPPRCWDLPDEIGAILPTSAPEVWIGLGRQGAWRLHDDGGNERVLAAPFDSARQRFNDARADTQGRIWVSTLVDARAPPEALLYRLTLGAADGDRGCKPRADALLDGFTVGNGLAFAPDGGALYVSDTTSRIVWRCAFDTSTGAMGAREVFVRYPVEGRARPDGAAVSEDGHYWVAVFEGARIDRWSSQGELVRSYPLPLACPTMPCFAGDDRRTLVVASAGRARPAEERIGTPAGDLLLLRVDVAGLQEQHAAT